MKTALATLLLLLSWPAFAQPSDTVTIAHKCYSTTFSKSRHFPLVVKYWLTKEMFSCAKKFPRPNSFTADPQLPAYTKLGSDYSRSGYDQGHNMDADDNSCDSIGMAESFYYSNVCPQTPRLNRGIWKTLEEFARTKAQRDDSVLVWCGSVATGKKHIGSVAVPTYCWKVLYVKKLGVTEAYSFKNNSAKSKPLASYKVSVDSVWHLSGVKFKTN
jgi:endonuclease G, mitochondrial